MDNDLRGLHRREILLRLAIKQRGRCGLCGNDLGELEMRNVDHIIPRSKGGTDRWANIQATHITCNHDKDNRLTATFDGTKWVSRIRERERGR